MTHHSYPLTKANAAYLAALREDLGHEVTVGSCRECAADGVVLWAGACADVCTGPQAVSHCSCCGEHHGQTWCPEQCA